MVAFAGTHGWDNVKGEEPLDKRAHLAEEVFNLLKKAKNEAQIALSFILTIAPLWFFL
ncbi:MAG: hypothetical protein MUE53_05160 [Chitinophagales bacterium]|jgi:hypothetical protein|nr:hypothetical protein [Chitinophagales bacterium]